MLLDFLEQLGVTFEIDWDNEVIIKVPEDLQAADAMKVIANVRFEKHLARTVTFRAQRARSVYVGGRRNGERVGLCWGNRTWIANRVKRARWEAYELSRDGRAFFRGYATSQAKAKRGEIAEQTASKKG